MRNNNRGQHNYNLTLAFDYVKNGKSKLVAACTIVKQNAHTPHKTNPLNHFRGSHKYIEPKTTAKAINLEWLPHYPNDGYIQRVEAVRQFLHKAKTGDNITISTIDDAFFEIVQARNPLAMGANQLWNEFTEQFNVSVRRIRCPEVNRGLQIAQRLLHFHIEQLTQNNKESKGYINNHTPGRR